MPKRLAGAIVWVLEVGSVVSDEHHQYRSSRDEDEAESELRAAAQRLEQAVERLVQATTNHLSDTVVASVEGTVDRVRERLESRRSRARNRRNRRRSYYAPSSAYRGMNDRGERKLYRDPRRKKIAGVCAGLAEYFGTDPWVIRTIALCMLFFTPLSGVTFMAYWVAYFVMDVKPDDYDLRSPSVEPVSTPPRRRRGTRDEQIAARSNFRNVRTSFGEIESRLRSMESYVTSTQFELQRELSKISDGEGEEGEAP